MRVLVLLAMLVPFLGAGENLFPNGDLAGGIEGWWMPGSPHRVTVETKDSPPGAERSVRVDITKEASGDGQLGRYITGLKKHTTYYVQAMARSSTRGLAYIQIKLIRDRKELRRISSDHSDLEWTRLVQEFDTEDADRVAILCRYKQGSGCVGATVWFADIRLTEGPGPEPGEEPQEGPPALETLVAVPTFHSLSVTAPYRGTVPRDTRCGVRFRRAEEKTWRDGLDLVRYGPDRQFRGSLLLLQPDSEYQVECRLMLGNRTLAAGGTTVRTWSEEVPVGEVRALPPVTRGPLVIRDQGKPDAWVVYRPAEGKTALIDAGAEADNAVRVEKAAYVVIENLTIRGGRDDCVYVSQSHHVRIRCCDIAGWGDPGTRKDGLPKGLYVNAKGTVINGQAGIQLHRDSTQIVVEHNLIHAPRGTANSWKYGHPAGPQGMNLSYTGGNHVIRYNDIIGSETHWWNDAIEGAPNSDVIGGPHRDTDIYGNVLAFSNDDGTELDGGQINVRFWGNWVDKALCGVSCAPNRRGPSYVFRNLFVLTGDEHFHTGAGFKMGGDQFRHPGVSFLLHNTVYTAGNGLTSGHYGKGPTPMVTRNNAFFGPRPGLGRIRFRHRELGDFDYDLIPPDGIYGVSPPPPGREAHAIVSRPKVRNERARDMRLLPDSPGIDAGVPLPGLNDDFTGKGPDLGAFERDRHGPDIPVRPGGMSALPLHAEMIVKDGAPAQAAIRIRVPPATGRRWTAIPNSPWLRCTPASGACGDEVQTVAVSLTAEDAEPRLHRGAVTFRTDRGFQRTVMVDAKVYPQPLVRLDVEAEAGRVEDGLVRMADPTASGGACLHPPEEQKGSVTFTFDVPREGVYYLIARCMVPPPADEAGFHDSFFVAVDGGEKRLWALPTNSIGAWMWQRVSAKGADLYPRTLPAGRHVVTFAAREALPRLDRVVLTNVPYLEPDE